MEYSVLISVYYKEKAEYLIECLESMVHQTVEPSEIVIVKDGKLTVELEDVLTEYKTKYQRLSIFNNYYLTRLNRLMYHAF